MRYYELLLESIIFESIGELKWEQYGSWINPVLDEVIEVLKAGGHINSANEWLRNNNKERGVMGIGQLYARMFENNWVRLVYEKSKGIGGELSVCGSRNNVKSLLPIFIRTLKSEGIGVFRFEDSSDMFKGKVFDVSSGVSEYGKVIRYFMGEE
jgi:hypothetical protein